MMAQQWQDTIKGLEIKTTVTKDTLVDQRASFNSSVVMYAVPKVYKDLYESQNLASLLSQQSSVFIKSYGVNSMATLSLRGASAAQSAVLWNGIPIMNPAVGVADLSLLQSGLFDNVSLQYGSSAALYGSGNVGGALLLNDDYIEFIPHSKAGLALGYGSFGNKNISLNLQHQTGKLNIALHSFYQHADNDINYIDNKGLPQKLANAALKGGGGLLDLDYNLLKKGYKGRNREKLYAKIWLQSYDREIPAALFESYSVKQQKDASFRTILGWEKVGYKMTYYVKTSYDREYLHYEDSAILLNNKNTIHQSYSEAGVKIHLTNPFNRDRNIFNGIHNILVFTPVQYATTLVQNTGENKHQFRPAIAAAYSYEDLDRRFKANLAIRQEWINGVAAPLLPGIGMGYDLLRDFKVGESKKAGISLQLKANVQKTYRIPTLNELYYFPGGNEDLKPEQGWNENLSYALGFYKEYVAKNNINKIKKIHIVHILDFFNRDIQDWIYWLGGAIWTPHNIAKVHSRGIETNNTASYAVNDLKFILGLNYTYVLSTTEASYLPGDGSIGKQIPYTPRYNAQGNLGVQWKSLFVNINQTYTGYRFVTIDESQYLSPYATTNLQCSYTFNGSSQKFITISGQLQNIFDTDYQVVNARPMPGRNFLLQVKLGVK